MLKFIKRILAQRRNAWRTQWRTHTLSQLHRCPLPHTLDLAAPQRVMLIAPHPDDDILGCGGTLAKLRKMPCDIHSVLLTDGSGGGELPPNTAQQRQQEFHTALAQLGITQFSTFNQPDGELRPSSELHQRLHALIANYQPDWLLLPSPLDYHRDHAHASAIILNASRHVASIRQYIFYEIWSPLPATHIVDITEVFTQKIAALQCHQTALAYGDYVRAVDGLNRYRGMYLGRDRWAEAFTVATPEHVHTVFTQLLDMRLIVLPH